MKRWLLLALLSAGWALRLYAIARQDLWGDEAFSVWLSRQPLAQVVAGGADTHPPLYPFLLFLWMRGAGHSVFAVRALSALTGFLLLPLGWRLAVELEGRGSRWAVLALFALSPGLIYYAQETRMYSLASLAAAISLLATVRLLRGEGRRRDWLLFALGGLAAAYTHYDTIFLLVAEGIVLLAAPGGRRRLRAALLTGGAMALAYLPWVLVQRAFLEGKAQARTAALTLSELARMVAATGRLVLQGMVPPSRGMAWLLGGLALLLLTAGMRWLFHRSRPQGWLLAAALVIPFVLAWLVNPLMPFFYPRYLLFVAVPLLTGMGLATAWPSRPLRWGAWMGLAVVLVAMGGADARYYREEVRVRGRYGQMMAYVEAHARPGDALLLANPLQRAIFDYYRPDAIPAYFLPRLTGVDAGTEAMLREYAERYRRLWLVRYGNPAEYDAGDGLVRWLAEHGQLAYHGGWLDSELYLFVMEEPDVPAVSGDWRFGEAIHLRGYTLSAISLRAGDVLGITLFWEAEARPQARYTVYTHLLAEDGHLVAQMDGQPQGGAAPTDGWEPGQTIRDGYAILIPEEAPPGRYTVRIGLYRLETGERLPVFDAEGQPLGDGLVLGEVIIGE